MIYLFNCQILRSVRGTRSLATVARLLRNKGHKATKASISYWERGLRMPRADVVEALAQIYAIDIKTLFTK